jgi:hypothetical protein
MKDVARVAGVSQSTVYGHETIPGVNDQILAFLSEQFDRPGTPGR